MDLAAFGQPVLSDAVKLCQRHKLRAASGTWKEYLEARRCCKLPSLLMLMMLADDADDAALMVSPCLSPCPSPCLSP
jgi:hypothetical protein